MGAVDMRTQSNGIFANTVPWGMEEDEEEPFLFVVARHQPLSRGTSMRDERATVSAGCTQMCVLSSAPISSRKRRLCGLGKRAVEILMTDVF